MTEIQKACKVYCDAKAAGKSNQDALDLAKRITTIGHVTTDFAWLADARNPKGIQPIASLVAAPEDLRSKAAISLRAGRGWEGQYEGVKLSWGRIVVAVGLYSPEEAKSHEGRLRTLFQKESGLASEGTRIGRGGRWLSDDQELYVGNHKGIGVEDAKPRQLDRVEIRKGADDYKSKLPKIAARKAAAVKRAATKTPAPIEVEVDEVDAD